MLSHCFSGCFSSLHDTEDGDTRFGRRDHSAVCWAPCVWRRSGRVPRQNKEHSIRNSPDCRKPERNRVYRQRWFGHISWAACIDTKPARRDQASSSHSARGLLASKDKTPHSLQIL